MARRAGATGAAPGAGRRAKAAGPAPSGAAPAKAAKGVRRTTPSPETLAGLDRNRLVDLVLGETARNPAFRKLVTAALAALQGADAVAAIVDRRLKALEGARGYIDWQKRRAFLADLDATLTVIVTELAALDRAAALDRLVRFLGGADGVLDRVDDSSGAAQAVYERASDAVADIAARLGEAEAGEFALALIPRFASDPHGPFGMLVRDLVPILAPNALSALDAALAGRAGARVAPSGKADEAAAFRADLHRSHLLRLRQDIADRRGDVDGYIALEQAIMPRSPDPSAIARRLLAADRPAEALDWIRRPRPQRIRVITQEMLIAGDADPDGPERDRLGLEIRALDALGRDAEAQALRWTGFATMLDADLLRAHLAKLPDFEDEETLDRALDHVAAAGDPHRALAFLIAWPHFGRAARLVLDRRADWRGDRYRLLGRAADALAESHPQASAVLYRRLVDDILGGGRSNAYPHAARYLTALDGLAPAADSGAEEPDAATYRANLRKAHGRKYGFWSLMKS